MNTDTIKALIVILGAITAVVYIRAPFAISRARAHMAPEARARRRLEAQPGGTITYEIRQAYFEPRVMTTCYEWRRQLVHYGDGYSLRLAVENLRSYGPGVRDMHVYNLGVR